MAFTQPQQSPPIQPQQQQQPHPSTMANTATNAALTPKKFPNRRHHFRSGMLMEAWKFSVYLMVPIVASVYFNNPSTQHYWADYFQYGKHPPVKQTFKELLEEYTKRLEAQEEQRKVVASQMSSLQESAERSRQYQQSKNLISAAGDNNNTAVGGQSNSWRWLGWEKS